MLQRTLLPPSHSLQVTSWIIKGFEAGHLACLFPFYPPSVFYLMLVWTRSQSAPATSSQESIVLTAPSTHAMLITMTTLIRGRERQVCRGFTVIGSGWLWLVPEAVLRCLLVTLGWVLGWEVKYCIGEVAPDNPGCWMWIIRAVPYCVVTNTRY